MFQVSPFVESIALPFQQSSIHCLRFGAGNQLFVALHGFGDSARSYAPLAEKADADHRFYALDLPLHGKTNWNEADDFNRQSLVSIIRKIMALEHAPQITLIGFSMGARLALSVLAEMPSEITRVVLLAPEGLGAKGMQLALAIPPKLHRQLEPLFNWLLPLPNWRILPSATQHFLQANLNRPDRRHRLFFYWRVLPHFPFNAKGVAIWLQNTSLPIDVFLGENDVLVDPKPWIKWAKTIPQARLNMLSCGHQLIQPELYTAITK